MAENIEELSNSDDDEDGSNSSSYITDDSENEMSPENSSKAGKGKKRKRKSAKQSPPKKVKRLNTLDGVPKEMLTVIESMFSDIFEKKAKSTQLTANHVKNLIKTVITDENVLSMVRNTILENEPSTEATYVPKMTRAKHRELLEKHCNPEELPPPPINPSSTGRGETRQLLSKEFPDEDEDEDDYKPEENSEDESYLSATTNSDWGSPSTPNSDQRFSSFTPKMFSPPMDESSSSQTPKEKKKPCRFVLHHRAVSRTLNFEETQEERICERTRSKKSLSDTPLEQLEMAFKPPDITKDMYEMDCDNTDWKNFLIEFINPAGSSNNEEDEQVDPEYNYLEDTCQLEEDVEAEKEEMRGDRAVQISKREYNDLINELLDSFDTDCTTNKATVNAGPDVSWLASPLGSPSSSEMGSPAFFTTVDQYPNSDSPLQVEIMTAEFSTSQYAILKSQMIQHVQLLTTTVLLCNKSSLFSQYTDGCIDMLKELKSNADAVVNPSDENFYKPPNLLPALETLEKYKNLPPFKYDGPKAFDLPKKQQKKDMNELLKETADIMLNSSAFPIVSLLPTNMFLLSMKKKSSSFTQSEDILIAHGLQTYFKNNVIKKEKTEFRKCMRQALKWIVDEFIVGKSYDLVISHYKNIEYHGKTNSQTSSNPILSFLINGRYKLPAASVQPLSYSIPCPLYLIPIKLFEHPWSKIVVNHLVTLKQSTPSDSLKIKNVFMITNHNQPMKLIFSPATTPTLPPPFSRLPPPTPQEKLVMVNSPLNTTTSSLINDKDTLERLNSVNNILHTKTNIPSEHITHNLIKPSGPETTSSFTTQHKNTSQDLNFNTKNNVSINSSGILTSQDNSKLTAISTQSINVDSPKCSTDSHFSNTCSPKSLLDSPKSSVDSHFSKISQPSSTLANSYSKINSLFGTKLISTVSKINCQAETAASNLSAISSNIPITAQPEKLKEHFKVNIIDDKLDDITIKDNVTKQEDTLSPSCETPIKIINSASHNPSPDSSFYNMPFLMATPEKQNELDSESSQSLQKQNIKNMLLFDISTSSRKTSQDIVDANNDSPKDQTPLSPKDGKTSDDSRNHDSNDHPVIKFLQSSNSESIKKSQNDLNNSSMDVDDRISQSDDIKNNSNNTEQLQCQSKTNNKPLLETEETPVATGQLPVTTSQPSVTTRQLPVATGQPPVATNEPLGIDESALGSGKSALRTDEPHSITESQLIVTVDPVSLPDLLTPSTPIKRILPDNKKTSPLKQVGPIIKKYRRIKNKPSPTKRMLIPNIKKILCVQKIKSLVPKESVSSPHSMLGWKNLQDDLIPMHSLEESIHGDAKQTHDKENAEHLKALLEASSTISSKRGDKKFTMKRQTDCQSKKSESLPKKIQTKSKNQLSNISDLVDPNITDSWIALQYLIRVNEALQDEQKVNQFFEVLGKLEDEENPTSPTDIYFEICEILKDFPDLALEFLMYLEPHQAAEAGLSDKYDALVNSREFLEKLLSQFLKQPQQAQKVIKTLQTLECQSDVTTDVVKATITPMLKHAHLVDSFTRCFMDMTAPKAHASDFEEIDFDEPGTPDSAENIILPDATTSPEIDCSCHCHKEDKVNSVCYKCGVRFIDGRIFVKCNKTLQPVKITYPQAKSENKKSTDLQSDNNCDNFDSKVKMCRSKTKDAYIVKDICDVKAIDKNKTEESFKVRSIKNNQKEPQSVTNETIGNSLSCKRNNKDLTKKNRKIKTKFKNKMSADVDKSCDGNAISSYDKTHDQLQFKTNRKGKNLSPLEEISDAPESTKFNYKQNINSKLKENIESVNIPPEPRLSMHPSIDEISKKNKFPNTKSIDGPFKHDCKDKASSILNADIVNVKHKSASCSSVTNEKYTSDMTSLGKTQNILYEKYNTKNVSLSFTSKKPSKYSSKSNDKNQSFELNEIEIQDNINVDPDLLHIRDKEEKSIRDTKEEANVLPKTKDTNDTQPEKKGRKHRRKPDKTKKLKTTLTMKEDIKTPLISLGETIILQGNKINLSNKNMQQEKQTTSDGFNNESFINMSISHTSQTLLNNSLTKDSKRQNEVEPKIDICLDEQKNKSPPNTKESSNNRTIKSAVVSAPDSGSSTSVEELNWTKDEDLAILQRVQRDSAREDVFRALSQQFKTKNKDQVKERFQFLLEAMLSQQ